MILRHHQVEMIHVVPSLYLMDQTMTMTMTMAMTLSNPLASPRKRAKTSSSSMKGELKSRPPDQGSRHVPLLSRHPPRLPHHLLLHLLLPLKRHAPQPRAKDLSHETQALTGIVKRSKTTILLQKKENDQRPHHHHRQQNRHLPLHLCPIISSLLHLLLHLCLPLLLHFPCSFHVKCRASSDTVIRTKIEAVSLIAVLLASTATP